MTDLLAALPPKPLPAANRPAPGSGLENTPGLEDDHLDTGQFWSTEDGPTFAEFLDIINPLQHIPVVSTLYRAITGDDIGTGPRVAGGMLFGGPVGALVSGITALIEEASGGDIGEHIAEVVNDFIGGSDDGADNAAAPTVATQAALPAGPQAAIGAENLPGTQAGTQTGPDIQQTAALAGAAQLNRIAVNPAAALGAVQGPVQHKMSAPVNTATATNLLFPARAMATPFAPQAAIPPTSVNPATMNARAQNRSTLQPAAFTTNGHAQQARAPGETSPQTDPQPAAGRTTIAAPQLSDAVSRSRRQQADLMLAQWAAQQMALQNSGGTASAKKDDPPRPSASPQTAPAVSAPAHPMLPPRNASPEWYAQAMDQALSRYRNGASTGVNGAPGMSLRR